MAQSWPRIGVDLGGTKVSAGVVDQQLRCCAYERQATPRGDYQGTVELVCSMVARLEAQVHALDSSAPGAPLPVGIGTPGAPEPSSGRMLHCNSLWLNGRPLLADLEQSMARPIALANDADCFALAQAHLQAGGSSGLLFGVILGTGVGGGWVQDGALRRGPNALAGEWGHNPLPEGLSAPGPAEPELAARSCYCGRLNCIETWLSGPGLARTDAELWPQQARPRDGAQIFAAGCEQTERTRDLYLNQLGGALATIVNAVDPDRIVLGGGLSQQQLLYDALPRTMQPYLFDTRRLQTPLLPPVGGDDSGLIGAALLC